MWPRCRAAGGGPAESGSPDQEGHCGPSLTSWLYLSSQKPRDILSEQQAFLLVLDASRKWARAERNLTRGHPGGQHCFNESRWVSALEMVLRGVSGQSMQDLVALDGPAASNLGSCMYANAVTRNTNMETPHRQLKWF